MTSSTLIERSSPSAAAWMPAFQRSIARIITWLLRPACTRPSGAPGSVFLLMGDSSVGRRRRRVVHAQQVPQGVPQVVARRAAGAKAVQGGHGRLDGQLGGVAAHRGPVLEGSNLIAGED